MKTLFLTAILVATSTLAASSDLHSKDELYMPNQAGGFLVITLENCSIAAAVKAGYSKRSYVTDDRGGNFEGCWTVSDFSKFPQQDAFNSGPAVATWWEGDVIIFEPNQFSSKKEHPYEKPTL